MITTTKELNTRMNEALRFMEDHAREAQKIVRRLAELEKAPLTRAHATEAGALGFRYFELTDKLTAHNRNWARAYVPEIRESADYAKRLRSCREYRTN
jgi:hypothetical protein